MDKDIIYFHKVRPYTEYDILGVEIPFTISKETHKKLYGDGYVGFNETRERIKNVLESRGYNMITVEWERGYIVALKSN